MIKFCADMIARPLLYMEDTKLYVRTDQDINSLIHVTKVHSKDIGIRGKMITTKRVELPEDNIVYIQDSYIYF